MILIQKEYIKYCGEKQKQLRDQKSGRYKSGTQNQVKPFGLCKITGTAQTQAQEKGAYKKIIQFSEKKEKEAGQYE